MKKYEFTRHAEKMMAERELNRAWLERGLESPDWVEADAKDSSLEHRFVRIPEFGSRVLRVIINTETTPSRVVTAYFDRALKGKP